MQSYKTQPPKQIQYDISVTDLKFICQKKIYGSGMEQGEWNFPNNLEGWYLADKTFHIFPPHSKTGERN